MWLSRVESVSCSSLGLNSCWMLHGLGGLVGDWWKLLGPLTYRRLVNSTSLGLVHHRSLVNFVCVGSTATAIVVVVVVGSRTCNTTAFTSGVIRLLRLMLHLFLIQRVFFINVDGVGGLSSDLILILLTTIGLCHGASNRWSTLHAWVPATILSLSSVSRWIVAGIVPTAAVLHARPLHLGHTLLLLLKLFLLVIELLFVTSDVLISLPLRVSAFIEVFFTTVLLLGILKKDVQAGEGRCGWPIILNLRVVFDIFIGNLITH